MGFLEDTERHVLLKTCLDLVRLYGPMLKEKKPSSYNEEKQSLHSPLYEDFFHVISLLIHMLSSDLIGFSGIDDGTLSYFVRRRDISSHDIHTFFPCDFQGPWSLKRFDGETTI
jgi:hypothetical protein